MTVPDRMDFYRETFDALPEGYQIISPDFTYLYVNEAVCRQARKNAEDLIGRTIPEVFPGIEKSEMFAVLARCMETGEASGIENKFEYDDGTVEWFYLSINPVQEGMLAVSYAVSRYKQTEDRAAGLNRLYGVLGNVNQAIVRYRDLGELFEKVCSIAIADGDFAMAWIGLFEDSGNKAIPVASRAQSAENGAKLSEWADRCRDCPNLASVQDCRPVVCNPCLCHESAGESGFRSLAAFALKTGQLTNGFLALYSNHSLAFDTDELKILDELAMDLSFAMEFAEKENRRATAELALRKSEDLFSKVFYLSPDAINVNRLEDGVFVSASLVRYGVTSLLTLNFGSSRIPISSTIMKTFKSSIRFIGTLSRYLRIESVSSLTIRPMASMCAATMTEGRGAGPVPCRSPCSEPSLPRLISLTSGRHFSSIILEDGSS